MLKDLVGKDIVFHKRVVLPFTRVARGESEH